MRTMLAAGLVGILATGVAAAKPKRAASSASSTATATTPATSTAASATSTHVTARGVQITDVKVGTGAEALDRKKLTVHYVGEVQGGKIFDSTRTKGVPYTFKLGKGQVLQGWDEGLVGMREGGVRKLVVPPALAYGKHGVEGMIPPDATLIFEIELIKVE